MKKSMNSWGWEHSLMKFDLKMKLTLFFVFLALFQLMANDSYAQNTRLSLDMQEATVQQVLREIEFRSEFKFLYNRRDVDLGRTLSITVTKKKINNILNDVFLGTPIEYEIVNKQIVLRRKANQPQPVLSEEKEVDLQFAVSGTVTDETGAPLPGANIVEKGTTNGTQTDFDGNFTITVSDKTAILVFSYIGYAPKEMAVGDQTQINVQLALDTASLDEVIVVGYGVQRKKDLTGSVVSVKAEDFTQGANYDAVQLLNGAAAGVNVSQVNSAPGSPLRIQIRGAGSINSDNSVLFVVDGLPGINPSSLNPGDIESIEVLKDASAAAIYGTRAANGVVLITTKRGRAGKTSLTYSSFVGVQSVARTLDVLNASDYARLINVRQPGTFTNQEISAFGAGTDWQNEIFSSALVQNHQISASGGTDKGNYYAGLNYFEQDGIVNGSGSQKFNLRLNAQSRPLENVLITANANFTRQTDDNILFSNGANENAGPINSAISNDPTLPTGLDDNGRFFVNPAIALDNPIALIEGISDETVFNRFYASLNANWEFAKNLTATVRLGGDIDNNRTDFFRNRVTQQGLGTGGQGTITNVENTHWLIETLLKYENTFGNDHDFSILGGATWEEFVFRTSFSGTQGFLSDVTGTDLLESGNIANNTVESSKFVNRLNGFIGRATYGYKNKYLLTASFRVDGSSRFAEGNRFAFFPSGSLGWRLSEEDFLKDNKTVDELKLRLGYGQLGNQGINNFETRQTLVIGGSSVFGGAVTPGVVSARLPNPGLRWETTEEVNVGVDYALFGNRISGSIDYFNRRTDDQLLNRPLPSVVGFTNVRTNIGSVRNTGVDFNIKTLNIDGNDFKWSSSLNLSFLKNEVVELPDFTQQIIGGSIGTFINGFTIVQEGSPLFAFFGHEINGIFQVGDDIANSPTPNVPDYRAGFPRFVDQNGDGTIDADDRVVLGDPFPDLTFGFRNTLSYKNLSLDFFFQGVSGIETLDGNVTESLYPTNSLRNSISRFFLDRWTPENPTNSLPSGEDSSLYGGAFGINSLNVVDASFARLKNVTLNYQVPLPNNSKISSLGVYIAADNLFTITDFEGYDPDASSAGPPGAANASAARQQVAASVSRVSFNSYPLARVFRLGLDVKF